MTTPIRVDIGDDADPIVDLCRNLIAAGYDPARPIHAYRGEQLVLTVRSLGEGAGLSIDERDDNGHGGTPLTKRRRPSEAGASLLSGSEAPCSDLQKETPIKWGVFPGVDRSGPDFKERLAFAEKAKRAARGGVAAPAEVLAVELGATLTRGPGAPITQDDESGLWRLQFPDGSLSDVGNLSWVKDAARRLGLLDRTGERVEDQDGNKWRRKVSAYEVATHVTRRRLPKPSQGEFQPVHDVAASLNTSREKVGSARPDAGLLSIMVLRSMSRRKSSSRRSNDHANNPGLCRRIGPLRWLSLTQLSWIPRL
jgi:hypothetical protein